jgi:hypothetical protein
MIDTGIIITGAVGIVTTIVSSLATWLFSRKKYNAEVEHDRIENLESSLDIYDKLSDSKDSILKRLLKESEDLAKINIRLLSEVRSLRLQVNTLIKILETELPNVNLEKYGVKIEHGSIIDLELEDEENTIK